VVRGEELKRRRRHDVFSGSLEGVRPTYVIAIKGVD
jgi:hypothetical protein